MTRLQTWSVALTTVLAGPWSAADLSAQTVTVERAANVAGLSAGARIVSHSTQADSTRSRSSNIIDGNSETGWNSKGDGPQTLVLELSAESFLTRFSFDNGGDAGFTVKDVKVSVSLDGADLGYREVGSYTLNKGESAQGFRLSVPTRARWIKLTIGSNYGGRDAYQGTHIHLQEFRAFGLPAKGQSVEDANGFRLLLSSEVLFDTDKSDLRADNEKALTEALSLLMEFPAATVRVDGHTDSTGTHASNQQLSEVRASRVKDWLDENRGSARWTLESKGWAATKPTSSNSSPSGRQRNRRVEITIAQSQGRDH